MSGIWVYIGNPNDKIIELLLKENTIKISNNFWFFKEKDITKIFVLLQQNKKIFKDSKDIRVIKGTYQSNALQLLLN